MNRKLKLILGPLIVLATFIGFGWYVSTNPEVLRRLSETPLPVIAGLLVLYIGVTLALMGVLYGSLALYGRRISTTENFYVNSYSSIINFFGPGQSGPAVRAAYLKLKHGFGVKQFMFGMLVYYGFYALFSGIIIAIAVLPWWLSSLCAIAGTLACIAVIQVLRRKKKALFAKVHAGSTGYVLIALAALLQVMLLATIYYIELHTIGAAVSVAQTLIYTGTANFALFVALTPGAIGFREAFLVFTQNLHHISSDSIVAANILDRALYVIFLGLLFVAILALRGRSYRAMKTIDQSK